MHRGGICTSGSVETWHFVWCAGGQDKANDATMEQARVRNGLFGFDEDLVEDAVAAEKGGILRMCEDNKASLKAKSKMRGFHPVERSVRVEGNGLFGYDADLVEDAVAAEKEQRSDRFGAYMRVRNGKIGYMIEVNDPNPQTYTKEKEQTSDLFKTQIAAFVEKDKCEQLDQVLSADFEGNAF
ncbi:unnamed protein product [Vitrella brassicaformis CCMP3155]|uniref:Uncharacterized protein n=1 Tax=Vitrella brassicaformis (strain CCMP3155) TaxID=1169540 RepID=A0A0G4EVG9_VITBC|nr:unnamed protein product [Vitrella brassicaformis CCMP3155]|eukprot:CEM02626.1 unnamed protein product [Vitrella brassicaformis CCMP3155]